MEFILDHVTLWICCLCHCCVEYSDNMQLCLLTWVWWCFVQSCVTDHRD